MKVTANPSIIPQTVKFQASRPDNNFDNYNDDFFLKEDKKEDFTKKDRRQIGTALGLRAAFNLKTLLWGGAIGTLIAGILAIPTAFLFTPVIIPVVMGVVSSIAGIGGFIAGYSQPQNFVSKEEIEDLRGSIKEALAEARQKTAERKAAKSAS